MPFDERFFPDFFVLCLATLRFLVVAFRVVLRATVFLLEPFAAVFLAARAELIFLLADFLVAFFEALAVFFLRLTSSSLPSLLACL